MIVWSVLLSCFLCFVAAQITQNAATRRRRPDLYIINGLRYLLYEVEEQKHIWNDFSFKKEAMSTIEDIAVCVEKHLPVQLFSSDTNTDYKIFQSASERATFLRSLKMWIATPMPTTRQDLAVSVAKNLMSAARGDWNSFDRLPLEEVKTGALQTRILGAIRAVFVAGLPAVILWLARRPPLHLVMPSYANMAVLIWAVVTLLVELDPRFTAKAEALKTIKDVFSGTKEK